MERLAWLARPIDQTTIAVLHHNHHLPEVGWPERNPIALVDSGIGYAYGLRARTKAE
jgi:hypothetical protein